MGVAVVLGLGLAAAIASMRSPARPPVVAPPVASEQDERGDRGDRGEQRDRGATPDPSPAVGSAARPAPAPAPAALARRDPGIDALRSGLASDEDATKIAAVEAAVRDGVVEGLPLLLSTELKHEPEAAPTIIHAIASLASQASSRDRAHAAQTLSDWLRDESGRQGRDAAGNVPNLVEALGDLGGTETVAALIAALDRNDVDLAVQTLIVQRLAALGDPRARGAVARFAARVAGLPPADDEFEERLRQEALAEANAASQRLTP